MLFNSFVFLFVFLPLVVVAYFAVPQHRARLALIVVASYVFYAYAKWEKRLHALEEVLALARSHGWRVVGFTPPDGARLRPRIR